MTHHRTIRNSSQKLKTNKQPEWKKPELEHPERNEVTSRCYQLIKVIVLSTNCLINFLSVLLS